MDYLLKPKKFETKFNNDNVTMTLAFLTSEQVMTLNPIFERMIEAAEEEKGGGKGDAWFGVLKMQSETGDVLMDTVKDIKGFEIDGESPSIEDIIQYPIFASLVGDIVTELIVRTSLTKEEVKNLKGQSVEPIEGEAQKQ